MIRHADSGDFQFVQDICALPENRLYIGTSTKDELAAFCRDPEMDLVIWEQDGAPAGFALFCEIGDASGRVELRRLGLGQTGTGLGHAFLRALIDHGFDRLNAARIWLDVVADNPRAQAVYHKAGFLHEGTLRQNWRRPNGDVVDMQIFGMLRAERPA